MNSEKEIELVTTKKDIYTEDLKYFKILIEKQDEYELIIFLTKIVSLFESNRLYECRELEKFIKNFRKYRNSLNERSNLDKIYLIWIIHTKIKSLKQNYFEEKKDIPFEYIPKNILVHNSLKIDKYSLYILRHTLILLLNNIYNVKINEKIIVFFKIIKKHCMWFTYYKFDEKNRELFDYPLFFEKETGNYRINKRFCIFCEKYIFYISRYIKICKSLKIKEIEAMYFPTKKMFENFFSIINEILGKNSIKNAIDNNNYRNIVKWFVNNIDVEIYKELDPLDQNPDEHTIVNFLKKEILDRYSIIIKTGKGLVDMFKNKFEMSKFFIYNQFDSNQDIVFDKFCFIVFDQIFNSFLKKQYKSIQEDVVFFDNIKLPIKDNIWYNNDEIKLLQTHRGWVIFDPSTKDFFLYRSVIESLVVYILLLYHGENEKSEYLRQIGLGKIIELLLIDTVYQKSQTEDLIF